MELTRKKRRELADAQKQWERVTRPRLGEGPIRHNDWLWEKPVARRVLDQLQALCEVTHHGRYGEVAGAQLRDGSARVEPSVINLSRRVIGPRGADYALLDGDRLVRTTANPAVAWKWLALKAGIRF